MKIPGETSAQSNIVKPVPLEATEDRIAALKLARGLKVEKLIEGLKTPRVIVTAPRASTPQAIMPQARRKVAMLRNFALHTVEYMREVLRITRRHQA